ncbi:MAG: hypothetical protein ACYS0F_15420 [Planctomycetota bacterium]
MLLLLLIGLFVACGGSDEKANTSASSSGAGADEEEEEEGGASLRQTYSADKGSATVSGTVKWEGKAPKRRSIDMAAEKYCVNCYTEGEAPTSESAIVGADGEFANVFVYIKADGLKGWKFPKGSATLSPRSCSSRSRIPAI